MPAKKKAVKKTAQTKQVIKAKKVISKTSSLTIKNNTVKKSATNARIDTKLKNVEAFHLKKQDPKKPKATSLSLQKFQPSFELALLSPFRFPIDTQQLAVSAARYGGVFFVAIGAIFTLIFASHSFSPQAQTALVSSTYDPATELLSTQCDNSGSGTDVQCGQPADQKPPVSFDLNNPSSLTGSVQVKVKVKDASSATLMAFYKTQNEEITIGRLTKVSSDTWEMYWNTDQFNEGEYKLKALVENRYGAYEAVDTKYVQIIHPVLEKVIDPIISSGTGDRTEEIADEDEEAPISSVVLSTDKRSENEFRFEIAVDGAEKVKVYARAMTATDKKLLGYAYKSSADIWRYRWLPGSVMSGEYAILAVAVINAEQFESNTERVMVGGKAVSTPIIVIESEEAGEEVTASSSEDTAILAPVIELKTGTQPPFSKFVPVLVDVKDALSVDVYLLPRNSLVQRYIGSAKSIDQDTWSLNWDTVLTPNGEYKLLAYVKNRFGTYSKDTAYMKVQNELKITYTETQQEQISTLTDIGAQAAPAVAILEEPSAETSVPAERTVAETEARADSEVSGEQDEASAADLPPEQKEPDINTLMASFKEELDAEFQRFAAALRSKDPEAIETVKARLETLKKRIVNSELGDRNSEELTRKIDTYLNDAVIRVEEDVKRVENILIERTAEKTVLDSDSDGISDYDEVAFYGTNPFGADSDNDGFMDGAEILSGYNPLDSRSEASVAYESPKEAGIIREDILQVSSIVTAEKNEGQEKSAAAIISGKALPNSFVTLYIFSTPVVVTIKTDEEGGWNYRFDKELEDGEHQIYVGVTDNAGKLVAKSNPFTFVKEAEAFTAVGTVGAAAVEPPRSFISEYMVYLVLSISVVAIGLVLILLGLHLDSRQRRYGVANEQAEAAI